jgi:hypothetical protein
MKKLMHPALESLAFLTKLEEMRNAVNRAHNHRSISEDEYKALWKEINADVALTKQMLHIEIKNLISQQTS